MLRGVLALILIVLILSPVAPVAGAGRPARPAPPAVPEAVFHDDFADTSGLEEWQSLVAQDGYLQVPPEAVWLQDTFADFYPGAGVAVDLYSLPGSIRLSRFSPDARVNDVAGGAQVQVDAAAALHLEPDLVYVYAVWADGRDGNLDIYFGRSTDGGATWETSRRLNLLAGEGDQVHPAIAALAGRIHVVWEDAAGIHHTRSQDYGTTWMADQLLVPGGSEPDIALGFSNPAALVYLLYTAEESPGDRDVFCLRSYNDGLTWEQPQNVVPGEPAGAQQRAPSVTMASGVDAPWAAWQDNRDGDWGIYAGRRGTTSWTLLRVDSAPPGSEQMGPALFFSPGNAQPICLWEDDRGGAGEIYWAVYDNDFLYWVEYGPLSGPGAGAPAGTALATASWGGWTAAPPGEHDTAWLRSYDGTSWGPPLLAPDHRPYTVRSSLAVARADVAQTAVAAIWSDDRDDAGDIFVSISDGTYQAQGAFTSTVHDFGDLASWQEISWTGDLLPNVLLFVRSGTTPVPDDDWSTWTLATNGATVPAPLARYLQYRAVFYRTASQDTPTLDRVSIRARPRSGWGISLPIGRCVAAWGEFQSGGYAPSGTTLTLSILDISGTALYSDVTSPFDLSALLPGQYPYLRLRTDMARSESNTPLLDWWQVDWQEGSIQANFSWEPQSIYTATLVQFTNLSTGTIAPGAFLWAFGDGVTSTLPVPAHSYALPGSYTVTLAASGECGTDVATATLSVLPLPTEPPTAAFDHGPLCPGQEVAFADRSTGAIWWQWVFGDGGQSTLQNPTHAYTASGDYSLTLTVSNTLGSATAAELMVVRPAPTAAFTWTAHFLTAAFTASVTGDPTLLWSFGDGYTATLPNPTHTYAQAGAYTVTLVAANACATAAVSATLHVTDCVAPAGLAATHGPQPAQPGQAVFFTATLAAGSPPLTYTWSFGDGSPPAGGPHASHTYSAAGSYTATVQAQNACGEQQAGTVVQVVRALYRVYLPLAARAHHGGDGYEPDGSPGQARPILLGVAQLHTFAPVSDTDWVYLELVEGEIYHFATDNQASGVDTILDLYFGASPVAHDDDSCPGLAACLDYTPTVAGRYHLRVTQYGAEPQWGPAAVYTLEVTRR